MADVNPDFDATDDTDELLDALKDGRDTDDPWGRANPRYLIEHTSLDKGNVEYQLRRLTDAGWVRKISRGLYEFVDDPRESAQ
ncbi:hypothetical protein GCM10009039_11670 [Halocalculus aciditolerans]|uniref:MarR family transcriptional regulator n=2 Tax=Halocalculus aciditolerans TaxID=1383812 RepID=A0A830FH23_9EURY|nr:hypothetical protein GCM10009039_11670 [Halocalculus aciditolerans]